MLDFIKPTIADIEKIRPYFNYSRSNVSENSVGVFYSWADYFDTRFAIFDDTLIIKEYMKDVGEVFLVPIGKNVYKAMSEIENYTLDKNIKLIYIDVTDKDIELLDDRYVFVKKFEPDWSDYIYNASDLINFSGRKYHGQKNHINYFKKTFRNYTFKEFEKSDIDDLKKFTREFRLQNEAGSKFFDEELEKCNFIIENNDKFKFHGLILKVENEIIGFSIGEIVKDTLFVHIEKANRNFRGAYPILVNEFAKHFATNVLYINREDSACDEGLKESKMQYHPCLLLEKYVIKVDKCKC